MNKNDPTMNTRKIVVFMPFEMFDFQHITALTPPTRKLITLGR